MNGMIAEEKSLARLDRFWRAKLHLHSETPTLHGTMKMRSYVQERFLDPFRKEEEFRRLEELRKQEEELRKQEEARMMQQIFLEREEEERCVRMEEEASANHFA